MAAERRQWRVQLLGRLYVEVDGEAITRFPRKTGALLAYLAYYSHRWHARDELIELFWPDAEPEAGRNSLRVALSALRRALVPDMEEDARRDTASPPAAASGADTAPPPAPILADRTRVRLDTSACITDVGEFDTALRAAQRPATEQQKVALLRAAVDLYRGDLLPEHAEPWIEAERQRLADIALGALRLLIRGLADARKIAAALEYAHRAIRIDPLRQESHRTLMVLYVKDGRPTVALEHYEELLRLLAASGLAASPATLRLVEQITQRGQPSADRSRGDLPPPHAAPTPTGNLPIPLDRFFGRQEEIESLSSALLRVVSPDARLPAPGSRAPRLLTLTGPGGTGKTRLAVEVAAGLRDRFRGGAWFVPLADLFDARLIIGAVSDALNLARAPRADPLDQVVEALSRQPALLVLDNFEQLAAAGGAVVGSLLERVPSLACLVTSRRRLAIAGERVIAVASLPIPGDGQWRMVDGCSGREETGRSRAARSPIVKQRPSTLDPPAMPEALMQVPAVQLFVDRAQVVEPDFLVSEMNAADVAALCDWLEGIPLAIELAAARASVLTPAQMLERMSQRFALLTEGRADRPSRHQSLWAAMEWSYHLLAPDLQQFFESLSVFRGGWRLEAAEAVCQEPLALDYLAQLRAHSIVLAEAGAREIRFRMLESLREFAAEKVEPEQHLALAQRHGAYVLGLVEEAEPHLTGAGQAAWSARIEEELDNCRAALDRCRIRETEAEIGMRIAGAMSQFWVLRGHLKEGYDRLLEFLTVSRADTEQPVGPPSNDGRQSAHPPPQRAVDPRVRAKALRGAGVLAMYRGEYDTARPFLQEAVALYSEWNDRKGIASSVQTLGMVAHFQGDLATARRYFERALRLHEETGNRAGAAHLLANLGTMAANQGDYSRARALCEESLPVFRELGDIRALSSLLNTLGAMAKEQGEYEQARVYYEESLAIDRMLGDRSGIARGLGNLGGVARHTGDYAGARSLYEQCLALKRELGEKRGIAIALNNLGEAIVWDGDAEGARPLLVESLETFHQLGNPVGIANAVEGLAMIAAARGRWERVTRLIGAAEALRAAIGMPLPPSSQEEYSNILAAARGSLGGSAFDEAWSEGQAMTQEEAVGYALTEAGT